MTTPLRYYMGTTDPDVPVFVVTVNEIDGDGPSELDLRLDLADHSPDGFAWGFCGSGPSQLALALLADATGDDRLALRLYHRFLQAIIAGIPQDEEWLMSASLIRTFARLIDGV